MKKILLLTLMAGSALIGFGQLTPAPTTNSTSTGVVPNGNIANCNFAPGTPQSCIHICRTSVQISGGAIDLTPRTISFQYYQVTSGNKSMHAQIFCGSTLLVNDCINATTDGQNVLMYKEYTGISCANKNDIIIRIQAHTNGVCGGTICGPLLVSVGGSPLPVDMQAFTATRSRSNVLLKWETTSEQNNSGFAIERKGTGDWEQVGFVPSQSLNGNSTDLLAYQYTDVNTIKGISQYRIRQVDFDGESKYTQIIAVKGEGQTGKTIVYPNPTSNGKVNIVFENADVSRDAQLVDMTGRVIKQWRGITTNTIQVDNLTPGIYSLRILVPETGEQTIEKIVVNKR